MRAVSAFRRRNGSVALLWTVPIMVGEAERTERRLAEVLQAEGKLEDVTKQIAHRDTSRMDSTALFIRCIVIVSPPASGW
jgi:hypothetical protein